MSQSDIETLRRAWDAYRRGDVAAASDALDPEVHWYGAGEPEGEAAGVGGPRRD